MKNTTGILIILIVSLAIIDGILIWQGSIRKQDQQVLKSKDNNATVRLSEHGQANIVEYTDGGKKCTSSDDCEGDCVTNVISNLGKEGTCQSDSSEQGCHSPVENNTMRCLMDDIMYECGGSKWDTWCEQHEGKLFYK